jgi:hypothetical protein
MRDDEEAVQYSEVNAGMVKKSITAIASRWLFKTRPTVWLVLDSEVLYASIAIQFSPRHSSPAS